jgi:hypothetical protein
MYFYDFNKLRENGGVWEQISPDINIEYQDAVSKNWKANGSQVDDDLFFMKIEPR